MKSTFEEIFGRQEHFFAALLKVSFLVHAPQFGAAEIVNIIVIDTTKCSLVRCDNSYVPRQKLMTVESSKIITAFGPGTRKREVALAETNFCGCA